MRRIFLLLLWLAVAFFLSAQAGLAQRGTSQPEERGWGSSWTAPATDQQRKDQELVSRCKTLAKAKNLQGIIGVCDGELRAHPDFFAAYVIRATAYTDMKSYDRAVADLDHAKDLAMRKDRLDAAYSVLTFRAGVNAQRNDYRDATEDLRAAVKIDRTKPGALNDLAWLLATAPNPAFRNGREAVGLAKKALAVAPSSQSYAVMDTLAAAYAELNEFPRAVETGNLALEKARAQIKDATKLAKFQNDASDRVRLFEKHQAYHAQPQS